MTSDPNDTRALFERLRSDFLGLQRWDPVIGGGQRRRVYLDTTATALMPGFVWRGLTTYLETACANSHTVAHRAGQDTTRAIEESRDAIGRLVGYDPSEDVVLFTGNGATGATNFLARALFPPELRPLIKRFPKGAPTAVIDAFRDALGREGAAAIDDLLARPVVITTEMEHHSNLLPWIEAVGHHNVQAARVDPKTGALDLDHLRSLLQEHRGRVRLLAVTAVSNVTGIINPVHELAREAHAVGAQILVDGAQWVPHATVTMHPEDPRARIDYLVLSGHKLYAPGSRGALIGSLQTLSGRTCVTDVGGGMVDYVTIEDFEIKEEVTAREEAGTPNILGSIAMGLVARALLTIGMRSVEMEEQRLCHSLIEGLERIEGVEIYGSTDLEAVPRAGVVTFNVRGLHHAVVARYLNDFHNIAVRNECFCAHPYVKCLLGIDPQTEAHYREEMREHDRRHVPGGVRASLGIYSTQADVDALCDALEALVANRTALGERYRVERDGSCHLLGEEPLPPAFELDAVLETWLRGQVGSTS